DAFQRISVEQRKESEQVKCVVNGGIVEDDQVLIWSAAAYIKSAGAFVSLLHPWHQLQYFQRILFTKQGGDLLYFFDRDIDAAHLHVFTYLFLPSRYNFDFFKL